MESRIRTIRRLLGVVHARLPEIGLEEVEDPRRKHGQRWSLKSLMTAVIVGIMSGCRSLGETEDLTEVLPEAVQSWLGLGRRVPDTTMRDALVVVEPDQVRGAIRRQVRAAHRRKALKPVGFPSGIVSIDGKYTATPKFDAIYSQRQSAKDDSKEYGLVRTLTCSLINARVTMCLDAVPIPAQTNEMGHFKEAVRALEESYGNLDLYEIIMGDAGMCSLENATFIHELGRGYIFRVKNTQPTLLAEMKRLLAGLPTQEAVYESTEWLPGKQRVTRRLWLSTQMKSWLEWTHLRVALRLEVITTHADGTQTIGNCYYATNVPKGRLKPEQWVAAFRQHWRIENHCHWTFDVIFSEDNRPWIKDPRGMVVMLLLRRLAYNLVALFRSVTQRSQLKRFDNWRKLLFKFKTAFLQANGATLAGLRKRRAPVFIA